ncbi:oxygenase MpaB family protein [Promicromonospora sp. Populi]|uniref:oxygenase MpaB family protein n=1 Tax=Promicromonospora sp. Populi TaxID=3239420 RepID=UPI0034E2F8C5
MADTVDNPVDSRVDDAGPTTRSPYPARFRAAEARGARIGRPLRLFGGVRGVDEALLDRIGHAFFEEDDAGAALAAAMRLPAGAPGRVTHAQLRTALAGPSRGGTGRKIGPLHAGDGEIGPLHRDRSINGPISVQGTDLGAGPEQGTELGAQVPDALRGFLSEVTRVPDWVDWDLVETGAAVQRRLGQNASDVLLQLSLVGGYRFGGPTDLLVATGALTGDALRRLAETQEWTVGLSEPGALRAYAPAWRATVHVRVMHALVSASFAGPHGASPSYDGSSDESPSGVHQSGPTRWDVARWGLPINQADQAATLGLFDGALILGCRALGVRIPPSDSKALMHLWKWVGHLMGVHPDFLVDDEWARHHINYHVLLAQAGVSAAGPRLAQAVVAAQADRVYRGPSWWQPWRARLERERLLSMLTVFLGVRSMGELGLPLRPPWAHAYLLPLNTWRYRVLGRTRRGRERLERWGQRRTHAIVASYQSERP